MLAESFYVYFLNFLYENQSSKQHEAIQSYVQYSFVNVIRSRALDDRTVRPVTSQIQLLLVFKKGTIRVYFANDKFAELSFELYTTFEELRQNLCRQLGIPETMFGQFGFYEVLHEEEYQDETFLEEFVRVSDLLASWDTMNCLEKTRTKGDTLFRKYARVYFRIRYFRPLARGRPDPFARVHYPFLACEIVRLFEANRVSVTREAAEKAFVLLVKMRTLRLADDRVVELMRDITERKEKMFRLNVTYSSAVKTNEVLKKLHQMEETTLDELLAEFVKIFEGNRVYKSQCFKAIISRKTFSERDSTPFQTKFDADQFAGSAKDSSEVRDEKLQSSERSPRKSPRKSDEPPRDPESAALGPTSLSGFECYLWVGPEGLSVCNMDHSPAETFPFEALKSLYLCDEKVKFLISPESVPDSKIEHNLLVFQTPQARMIFVTAVNFIKLRITGNVPQSLIKLDKQERDTRNLTEGETLRIEEIDQTKPIYPVSRYHVVACKKEK